MELIGDAAHLFGCVCLSGHRTSRPMFRVLVRNSTAETGKMVADGARRISEALEHGADRGRRALSQRGVEYARHFGTVAPASVLGPVRIAPRHLPPSPLGSPGGSQTGRSSGRRPCAAGA